MKHSEEEPMARHVFIIITEPPSVEEADAHERWYVDRHMPDVLAVPGMVKAQRFRMAADRERPEAPVRSLTIYEMETDDCGAVMAEIRRRVGSDAMPLYSGSPGGAHTSYLGEAATDEMFAGSGISSTS